MVVDRPLFQPQPRGVCNNMADSANRSANTYGIQSFDSVFWEFENPEEPAVFPFCVEETIRISPYRFYEKGNLYLMFVMLKEGAINYHFSGQDILLVPGQILVIPRDSQFLFESYSTTNNYHKIVFELKGRLLEEYEKELGFTRPHVVCVKDIDFYQIKINSIRMLLLEKSTADIPRLLAETYEFIYTLSSLTAERENFPRLLADIRKYIDNHLNTPINVSRLCLEFGISKSSLARLFSRSGLETPSAYWLKCKIHSATYFLLNTKMSVKEIAFELGFSSQFHFSKVFSAETGKSPLQFRKSFVSENQNADSTRTTERTRHNIVYRRPSHD